MKKIFKRVITDIAVLTTAATMFTGIGVSAGCFNQGDANMDGVINVRDAACISSCLANNNMAAMLGNGDYNTDGKVDIRDAAAIAKKMTTKPTTYLIELGDIPEDMLLNCPVDRFADSNFIAEISCCTARVVDGGLVCDGYCEREQLLSKENPLYICIDVELSYLTHTTTSVYSNYVSNVETERVFGWAEVRAVSTREYELTMLGWDYTCYDMSEDMQYFLQNYSPDQFYFAEGMEILEDFL